MFTAERSLRAAWPANSAASSATAQAHSYSVALTPTTQMKAIFSANLFLVARPSMKRCAMLRSSRAGIAGQFFLLHLVLAFCSAEAGSLLTIERTFQPND